MIMKTNFKRFLLKTAVGVGVFMCTLFFMSLDPTNAQEASNIKSESGKEQLFSELKYSPSALNPLTIETQNDINIPQSELKSEFVSQVRTTPYEFNAIGPYWKQFLPEGSKLKVKIRIKDEIGWTVWQDTQVSDTEYGKDDDKNGEIFGELLFTKKATAYQYKIILERDSLEISPRVFEINFNYIDSTQDNIKDNVAQATPTVKSRAAWGCPEANYSSGWAPQHQPVTHTIVHHTAGTWNTADPASSVRAIWSYHTYTKGWGDIGYNYLIDGYGNIYEGRYGGDNVVAGHAYPYNWGSIGISIMGDYTSTNISTAARNSLIDLTGYKMAVRGVKPSRTGIIYAKNSAGDNVTDAWGQPYRTIYRMSGHRDVAQTSCPGEYFYGTFTGLRYDAGVRYEDYRRATGFSVAAFSISPTNPEIGQNVTVNMSIRNESGVSKHVDSLNVVNFYNNVKEGTTLVSSGIDFGIGETKNFTLTTTYDKIGSYRIYPSIRIGDSWITPLESDTVYRNIFFSVKEADIIKPKVSVSLTLSPENPTPGQSTMATFTVKNYESSPLTLSSLGVAVRNKNSGNKYDFTWKNVTLDASGTYSYSASRTFSEKGPYYAYVSSYFNGAWQALAGETGITVLREFEVGSPANLVLTQSLAINPQDPIINQSTTATYKVKNTGEVTYRGSVGVKNRFDPDGVFGNYDYSWKTVAIAGGQTYTYSSTRTLPESGDYRANAQYHTDDYYNITEGSGISGEEVYNVYNSPADPKITVSLDISPDEPLINQQTTATFSVRNFGDAPARFGALGVAVRNGTKIEDFPWGPKTIAGGATENISLSKTFTTVGDRRMYVSAYWPDGHWGGLPTTDINVTSTSDFSVVDLYDKIKVSSFSISPTNPVIGEQVTATVKLRNSADVNINVPNFGVACRINPATQFKPCDFGYQNVTVSANSESSALTFTQTFNEYATYEMFNTYYNNGKWYRPISETGVATKLSAVTHAPNLKIVSGLAISPTTPSLGSNFTGAFGLKNYDSRPITLTTGVAVRYGTLNKDILWVRTTIAPGAIYNYSQSRAVDAIGEHRAWVSVNYPPLGWFTPSVDGGVSSKTFTTSGHVNPTIQATSSTGSYYIKNSAGQTLATRNVWNPTYVSYNSDKYYVTSGSYAFVSDTSIRLEPISGAVMQLTNYTNLAYDGSNDNQFRGNLDIKYSSATNKLWAINDLNMELYLRGIGETSSSSPMEHLKVMSVAARTYARYHKDNDDKYPNDPIDCDNSTNCQVYKGYRLETRHPNLTTAVNATTNQAVKYSGDNQLIVAAYSHGYAPTTLSSEEVWGTARPYLVRVSDPYGATDLACGVSGNHCVGLSASGSIGYANHSWTWQNILTHYYTDTYIGSIPNENIAIGIYSLNNYL